MNEQEKIKKWVTPKWHKDFGDPEKEMRILKDTCLFVAKLAPSLSFEIDHFEPGYIRVEIYKERSLYGEIYGTDVEKNQIGLFLESGEEIYISYKFPNKNELSKKQNITPQIRPPIHQTPHTQKKWRILDYFKKTKMNEKEKIKKWVIPKWHKDVGDPKKEMKRLKEICLLVAKLTPSLSFKIEHIASCYMCVGIYKKGSLCGKFYPLGVEESKIDVEESKIGLFLESGEEIYITNVHKKPHLSKEEEMEKMIDIIKKRVDKGGGYKSTHAGEPAVFYEDGKVIYVIRENGEFWTILKNTK